MDVEKSGNDAKATYPFSSAFWIKLEGKSDKDAIQVIVSASHNVGGLIVAAAPLFGIATPGTTKLWSDVPLSNRAFVQNLDQNATYVLKPQLSAPPGEQQLPAFNHSSYELSFPHLEPNDNDLPLLGRQNQLKIVRDHLSDSRSGALKYEVISVISTRGMGKTFFMKRLALHRKEDFRGIEIPAIQRASFGCILGVECATLVQDFGLAALNSNDSEEERREKDRKVQRMVSYFWQCIIVQHLARLFYGSSVDGINFSEPMSIATILSYLDPYRVVNTSLEVWVQRMLNGDRSQAVNEWCRLTSIVFHQACHKPVFLLDNIHAFAHIATSIPSTGSCENHTALSSLLNVLYNTNSICIIAGTSDGYLNLVSEYSNFVPLPISLETFTEDELWQYGEAFIEVLNRKSTVQLCWLPAGEKDPLLICLFCSACNIPRLVKIAIIVWYKALSDTSQMYTSHFIMMEFSREANAYYKDACRALFQQFTAKESAILLLSCSVNYSFNKALACIPSTELRVSDLVNKAIIFPAGNHTYCIPSCFWTPLEEDADFAIYKREWDIIKNFITLKVPGVSLSDLHLPLHHWCKVQFSLSEVGRVWEKMFASSIAVKYLLLKLETGNSNIAMVDILSIPSCAQAHKVLHDINVCLSEGVIVSKVAEVLVDGPLVSRNAISANYNFKTAIPSIISGSQRLAVQNKNMLSDPTLWNGILVYPGLDQTSSLPPKNYRVDIISDALVQEQITFVGQGAVAPVVFRSLCNVKQIMGKNIGAALPYM